MRTSEVVDVWTHVVYENDHYVEGRIDEPPDHRRPEKFAPRGRAIGYYAVAKLAAGGHRVVGMSVNEVKQHRQRYSQAAKNRVWNNNFNEMALKTVLRQLCHPRQLPMTAEIAEVLRDEEGLYAYTPGRAQFSDSSVPILTPAELQEVAVEAAEDLFGERGGEGLQQINSDGAV